MNETVYFFVAKTAIRAWLGWSRVKLLLQRPLSRVSLPSPVPGGSGRPGTGRVCLTLVDAIDARSPYTCMHSWSVAHLAVSMARAMNLPQNDVRTLYCAGLVHDLGKIALPRTLLEKQEPLTDREWTTVRLHPEWSFRMLRRMKGFEGIALLARLHHERLDGTGYPDGLSAPQIPLTARILAMADVYDALSASRPYRRDLAPSEVFAKIEAQVPHALDAACFEALKHVLHAETLQPPQVEAPSIAVADL